MCYSCVCVCVYFCWSLQQYMAVQLMKKGFAVGTLVDRLRMKEPVDQTAVSDKLNTARCDVSEAETILDEVYTATTRLSIY